MNLILFVSLLFLLENMSELTKRVLVAVVGIPFALFFIFLGGVYFLIPLALFSSIAIYELYNLISNGRLRWILFVNVLFNLVCFAFFYLIFYSNCLGFVASNFLVLTVLVYPLIILVLQVFSKEERPTLITLSMVGGSLWITFAFLQIAFVRNFPAIAENIYLLKFPDGYYLHSDKIWAFVVAILSSIWVCDSFAYFFGKWLGRHKLAPKVSPNKTIEGAVAGIFGAFVGFELAKLIFPFEIPALHFIVYALIVATVGQLGDLAESKIKRGFEVKDSSNILPGHGGILDRFDSIMFVFPLILVFIILSNL